MRWMPMRGCVRDAASDAVACPDEAVLLEEHEGFGDHGAPDLMSALSSVSVGIMDPGVRKPLQVSSAIREYTATAQR